MEPTTTDNRRRVQRGDHGPTRRTDEQPSLFPNRSVVTTLATVAASLGNSRQCNPDALNDLPGLPAAILEAPAAQQCMMATNWLVERETTDAVANDRRRFRAARPGDAALEAMGDLDNFPPQRSRPALAKKYLDRARQLYATGASKLRIAIAERGADAGQHRLFTMGNNGIYVVAPEDPQRPMPGKLSAAWCAYVAYRLVRDYEVNPLAPTDADGGANPHRAREDGDYVFLMGSTRLQPNRLGLGDGDVGGVPLWGDVPPVAADADARDDTDGGLCLRDIHEHMPPPHIEGGLPRPDDLPPGDRPPRRVGWATPGQAYPAGQFRRRGADGQPQDADADHDAFVAIYYPSGRSALGAAAEARPAVPPFRQTPAAPPAGLPDTNAGYWDARVSLALLNSEMARLRRTAVAVHARDQARAYQLQASLNTPGFAAPRTLASQLPTRLWEHGPVVNRQEAQARVPARPLPDATAESRVMPDVFFDPGAGQARVNQRTVAGERFPLGDVPPSRRPEHVNPARLPRSQNARQRMLQHALFLLSSPRTPWQQESLPLPLWGPLANQPGAGQQARTNLNELDATRVGWAGVPAAPPPPLLDAVPWQTRTAAERHAGVPTSNGVPLGPFLLDPRFGLTHADFPGTVAYVAALEARWAGGDGIPEDQRPLMTWVVRTNQQGAVDGDDTLGLDFYFPMY